MRKISHKTVLVLYMPHPETGLYVDHRPAKIASHRGLECPIGGDRLVGVRLFEEMSIVAFGPHIQKRLVAYLLQ